MTTTEDKIDLLVIEVKALQASQMKLTSTVEAIGKWSLDAEKYSVDLNKDAEPCCAYEGIGNHYFLYHAANPAA